MSCDCLYLVHRLWLTLRYSKSQGLNFWFQYTFDDIITYSVIVELSCITCALYVSIHSYCGPSPASEPLLELGKASSDAMCWWELTAEVKSEAWSWGDCERSASMWGKKEDRGQSEEVCLANTWSCSGLRLASSQTFWHKAETLWHVFNFIWLRWLLSVISFSLSVFYNINTMSVSKGQFIEMYW